MTAVSSLPGRAIVVTGMHRSGTSMVAKALRLAGLELGGDQDLVPPAPDNPDGFYELAAVVRVDDDLLQATGGAWDHPPMVGPMGADDPRVAHLVGDARAALAVVAGERPWGWKDPRFCLTAPFWLDLASEVRIIVCVRNPLEVALSLKRRNQSSYTRALALWRSYNEALLAAVASERLLITHYAAYFGDRGDDRELRRVLEFAGLEPGAASAARVAIDGDLRHHRLELTLTDARVSEDIVDLYERLCRDAGRSAVVRGRGTDVDVDRTVLDLAVARRRAEERARSITTLEREGSELRARVAQLEDEVARARDGDVAALHRRLDHLEQLVSDAVDELRYRASDRADAAALVVRGCRELVRRHLARDAHVLVVAKGDPELLDLYGRASSPFPQDADRSYPGFTFSDGWAAIAHLEALRAGDASALLVPEWSRWWLATYPVFARHLRSRYAVVADDAGTGLLVDLTVPANLTASAPAPTLASVVDRLTDQLGVAATVLDWTARGLADHPSACKVFRPPPPAGASVRLPYLDGTVDAVVLDTVDERTRDEALRVAQHAVVVIDASRPELPVVSHDTVARATSLPSLAPVRVVVAGVDGDADWRRHVGSVLAGEDIAVVDVADLRDPRLDDLDDVDAVVLVDQGVLPLPGCVRAGRAALAGDVAGVAVKLFARDGAVEAAGATVFSDGSVAGIAGGSHDVAAPWHDFVRPVCAGHGLTVLRPDVIRSSRLRVGESSPAAHAVLAAAVWADRRRVLYQPEAAAVRIRSAPVIDRATVASAWAAALGVRPERPAELTDATWRALLGAGEIEEIWW